MNRKKTQTERIFNELYSEVITLMDDVFDYFDDCRIAGLNAEAIKDAGYAVHVLQQLVNQIGAVGGGDGIYMNRLYEKYCSPCKCSEDCEGDPLFCTRTCKR